MSNNEKGSKAADERKKPHGVQANAEFDIPFLPKGTEDDIVEMQIEVLKKSVSAPKVDTTETAAESPESEIRGKFPKTQSLLAKLDRYLGKKFISIAILYACTVTICAVVIVINNAVILNASGGETIGGVAGNLALNQWLYSLIALFTFLFLLALIYLIASRRNKKNKKGT